MDIREELQKRAEQVNGILEDTLPADDFAYELAEAMSYSLIAGGKRLRPILLLESFLMFCDREDLCLSEDGEVLWGEGEEISDAQYAAECFATAIELIHTHSLVHDDLPALDNDDLRRGKPTTHAQYGEALGVLAGDALLNYAYEVAFDAVTLDVEEMETVGVDINLDARSMDSLRILSHKTGIFGMLGGQSADVQNEKNGLAVTLGELNDIYATKTAALFEASLMIGALLGGASLETADMLEELGERIGLAFQIRDDILDATASTDTMGKPAGSDERNQKTTYVTLLGVEGAGAEVARLTEEALAILDELPKESAFLRELISYLAGRTR